MCHFSVISKPIVTENDSLRIDSTQVKYFYKNLNNLTLGKISIYDTTTLLASYYEPLEKPYEIYQTLSNSGLAHKNIGFFYPIQLGFNSELSSFSSYILRYEGTLVEK